MKVGEIYQNPRGRLYKIVLVESDTRVRVADVETGKEDGALSGLMIPANGWRFWGQYDPRR